MAKRQLESDNSGRLGNASVTSLSLILVLNTGSFCLVHNTGQICRPVSYLGNSDVHSVPQPLSVTSSVVSLLHLFLSCCLLSWGCIRVQMNLHDHSCLYDVIVTFALGIL